MARKCRQFKGVDREPRCRMYRISPGCGGGYIKGPNGEQGGCWAESLVSTRMAKNRCPISRPCQTRWGWSGVVKLVPERLKDIVAPRQIAQAQCRKRTGTRPITRVRLRHVGFVSRQGPFRYIAAVFGGNGVRTEALVLRAHETARAGDRVFEVVIAVAG